MGRWKCMGLLNHSSDTHLNYLRPVSYFSPSWIPLRVHCQDSYSDWWLGGWQPVFLLPEFPSGYSISDSDGGWWLYGHNILCLLKWQTNSVFTLYIPTVQVYMIALCVRLLVTPWTAACQAPTSMEFSRQEYWSGLPFLPSGYLSNPGMEHTYPVLAGRFFTTESPGKLSHTH